MFDLTSIGILVALIIVGGLIFFVVLWIVVGRFISGKSGMSKKDESADLGRLVARYGKGSGRIRKVDYTNALVVDRYEHGYLLTSSGLLGSGARAIHDNDIASIDLKDDLHLFSIVITLKDGESIRLMDRLGKNVWDGLQVQGEP